MHWLDLVRDHYNPIHKLAQFPGLPKYFSKKIKDLNIKGSKYKYFFQLMCNIILICLSLSKKECYSCPPHPVWHENCCPRACQSSPRARGPRAGLTPLGQQLSCQTGYGGQEYPIVLKMGMKSDLGIPCFFHYV